MSMNQEELKVVKQAMTRVNVDILGISEIKWTDSMVPAQRQKYRSMEQNRKPRDKSTHLWTPYLRQRRQEYTMD